MTSVENFYVAGLCLYNGYKLIEVRSENRNTSFIFEMNQWSLDEIAEAFDCPEGQPITDVKAYAEALQKLSSLQKKARQNRDGVWTSRAWISGGKEADPDCT